MMPMMSGSLFSLGRTMRLQMQWQKRRDDPNAPKGREESAEMRHLREQARSTQESNVLAGIGNKLKTGGRLTVEEKNYLRINAPQLYQKAVELEAERESYKRALENCRTREEVERLHMQKTQSLVGEIGRISNNPNIPEGTKLGMMEQINSRTMGIQAEQNEFVSSGRLDALPTEEEERERLEAERERLTGQTDQPVEQEPPPEEPPTEQPPAEPTDRPAQAEPPPSQPPAEPTEPPKAAPATSAPAVAEAAPPPAKGPARAQPAAFLNPTAPQSGRSRLARRA